MDEIVFVDANIFLEIALQDKRNEECKKFIKQIIDNKLKAYTSDFIIYICLIQLQFKSKENLKKMKEFLMLYKEAMGEDFPNTHLMNYTVFFEIDPAAKSITIDTELFFDDNDPHYQITLPPKLAEQLISQKKSSCSAPVE